MTDFGVDDSEDIHRIPYDYIERTLATTIPRYSQPVVASDDHFHAYMQREFGDTGIVARLRPHVIQILESFEFQQQIAKSIRDDFEEYSLDDVVWAAQLFYMAGFDSGYAFCIDSVLAAVALSGVNCTDGHLSISDTSPREGIFERLQEHCRPMVCDCCGHDGGSHLTAKEDWKAKRSC